MAASNWNPWSQFLALDYFSRVYFVGAVCTVIWGYFAFLRFMIGIRRGNQSEYGSKADTERQVRNLHSIESFAMVLTSGCCTNQIFGVWFTYMARVTDANPFFALRESWIVAQILICLIVSLDALRRFAFGALERQRIP
jgi:formate hydrogenlyase subunit 3/multisubunit Na+/H+ antiporter MnhD subunit